MKEKLAPWLAVILPAAWLFGALADPTPAGQPHIHEFGKIPVVEGGRVKPLDSVARTYLRIVSDADSFEDDSGRSQPAIAWLLDVEAESTDPEERARKGKVFKIDHPQVRGLLELPPREHYRYSLHEFAERLPSLAGPLKQAHARKDRGSPLDDVDSQLLGFERRLASYGRLASFATPHLLPPRDGSEWRRLGETGLGRDPRVDAWGRMLTTYGTKDVKRFNDSVASYLEGLRRERPDDVQRAVLEARFNRVDPFNKAKVFYLAAFVLAALAWLGWSVPFNRASWSLLAFTFVVHTVGLVTRILLTGRPPVVNLYSSALFVGWGAVLVGLLLERIFRIGVGNVLAAISGTATLQIAHLLASDGDTMEVLQAVLDTQFWLATHVTTMTLGHATTYAAGLLGAIFILRGAFTRSLSPEIARSLSRMIYTCTCLAMFFSLVGTVLGGLWADDSWGRFWGWDPKENGALMVVLWNALALHARWGGIAGPRGLAVLAVFGNLIASWAYFGVNQLSVGLHSYGFTSGTTRSLWVFAVSQVAIIACAMKGQRAEEKRALSIRH
jgi:ABC-type transport system involved in cytochrome c biogenesis permease subunit